MRGTDGRDEGREGGTGCGACYTSRAIMILPNPTSGKGKGLVRSTTTITIHPDPRKVS